MLPFGDSRVALTVPLRVRSQVSEGSMLSYAVQLKRTSLTLIVVLPRGWEMLTSGGVWSMYSVRRMDTLASPVMVVQFTDQLYTPSPMLKRLKLRLVLVVMLELLWFTASLRSREQDSMASGVVTLYTKRTSPSEVQNWSAGETSEMFGRNPTRQLTLMLCGRASWLLTTLKFAEKLPSDAVEQLNRTLADVPFTLVPLVKLCRITEQSPWRHATWMLVLFRKPRIAALPLGTEPLMTWEPRSNVVTFHRTPPTTNDWMAELLVFPKVSFA